MLGSLDYEPKVGYTAIGLKPTISRFLTKEPGEALVFLDESNQKTAEELAKKAWFLHEGGWTSPKSMIPNKFVPARPFMWFPWVYMKSYFIEIIENAFKEAVINIMS